MRALLIAAAIAVAASSATAQAPAPTEKVKVRAGDYKLDKHHAKIVWSVQHMGFSTYYGQFTDFDAQLHLDPDQPENSRVNVTIQVPSIQTNNPDLDKHLKSNDFFAADKYPVATFVSTAVQRTGPMTADVTGNFTLKGVTKPLILHVTFNKAGTNPLLQYVAGFSAQATVKRSEYGVSAYLGMVSDEVPLLISGEFHPA